MQLNYLAIFLAAVAAFVTGSIWYGIFGKHWMAALGKSREDMGGIPIRPMIMSFIAALIMGWVLAGIIGHVGHVSVSGGIISGAFVWFGFVITTMTVNHAYQDAKLKLTLIDGGHWLAVLMVMGAVIGWFGV